jgi:hypothetical protein
MELQHLDALCLAGGQRSADVSAAQAWQVLVPEADEVVVVFDQLVALVPAQLSITLWLSSTFSSIR